MPQLSITFLIGAALALALGRWLGRRIGVDAPWQRLIALGIACVVVGAAGAGAGLLVTNAAVADAPPANMTAGSAVMLIGVALAWFGALSCGVAWAHALRPAMPAAPMPDPEATLTQPPPPEAPDGRKEPS
jgi:hypothetical protein